MAPAAAAPTAPAPAEVVPPEPAAVAPPPSAELAAKKAARKEAKKEANKEAKQAAQDRRLVIRRYGALMDQLGLDPDQREKLTLLLVDSREASADFAGATAAVGADVSQDHDAFAGGVAEVRAQLKEQMRALLGDDDYAQFQAGDLAIRQTAVIERAQNQLGGGSERLTPAQAAQLQGVLQQLGVNHVNDTVLDRAGEFLSPSQLEALRQQQARRANGETKPRVQRALDKNRS
jgi:hypothetical protein